MRKTISLLVALAAVLSITGSSAVVAQDAGTTEDGPAFSVITPDQDPLGVPYEEWAERYATWFFWDATVATHPAIQNDCMVRQPGGDAFFLPMTMVGSMALHECTIESGQHILAWMGGAPCPALSPDLTPDDIARCTTGRASAFNPQLTIDGQFIPIGGNYWVQTEVDTVELLEGNIFSLPAGPTLAAVAGWWTMIEPLAPGQHIIMARDDAWDPELGVGTARMVANVTVVEPVAE